MSMQGMEDYAQIAAQSEKCNTIECLLTTLPKELLMQTFCHCSSYDTLFVSTLSPEEKAASLKDIEVYYFGDKDSSLNDTDLSISLQNDIKNFMQLRMTCKRFNKLLTWEAIEKYGQIHKNTILKKLVIQWCTHKETNHIPTLIHILVRAGADVNTTYITTSLLELAIDKSNAKLVATLLECGANPNIIRKYRRCPAFFDARTTAIAQMCIDSGANLHATQYVEKKNIVSHALKIFWIPLEVMKLYLKHGADAAYLDNDKSCILHDIGSGYFQFITDDRYYAGAQEIILEKSEFLLTIIPHMINTLNNEGKTPLDTVHDAFKRQINSPKSAPQDLERIVKFFTSHGGFTAQELTQQK